MEVESRFKTAIADAFTTLSEFSGNQKVVDVAIAGFSDCKAYHSRPPLIKIHYGE